MIRALIVDDEYLARERVAKLLESHKDITIIGQAKNGQQALELINEKEPDLLFLDVQMPDIDGFEVVKKVSLKQKPYIVFTTAYDSYAIKAFDIHALDYLLKPIDESRFDESILKVRQYFKLKRKSGFNDKLLELMKEFQQDDTNYVLFVVVKDRGREIKIDLDDVYYIEANGNYVNLKCKEVKYLHRATMNSFFESLDPNEFIRVHRSVAVNKRYIKHCHYLNNNEYEFLMKDNKKIVSSRSYKNEIMNYLN